VTATAGGPPVAPASARARFWIAVGAAVVVGVLARIAFVLWFTPYLHFGLDTQWYELTSGLIVDGRGLADPASFFQRGQVVPTAFRVPLYPTFLAGITEVFGATRTTFQVAGVAVGSTTIVLTALVGRLVDGARTGVIAAWIVALSPALLNVDASVMGETLQVPLVTLAVLGVVRWRRRGGWWPLVVAGLALGLAMLNRSDAMLVTVLLGLSVVGRRPFTARRFAAAAVVVGLAVVVVVPWSVRNHREVGTYALSTIDSAATLAGANCDTSFGGKRLGSWDPTCAGVSPRLDEVARQRRLTNRATDYMAAHAPRLATVVAPVRVMRAWGLWYGIVQARDEAKESRSTNWQLLTWGTGLVLLGFAIGGVVVARRRGLVLAPLLAPIVAVTVAAAATYGKQRLRAYAEPELAVLAAVAVGALVTRRRARRSGPSIALRQTE
jgi:4-amino-4-deoxy-L-arabinose transferase-like glycosyltransferase